MLWVASLVGEGNGTPLQYFCQEKPMYRGAWWATVHGVAKSQTRLNSWCTPCFPGSSAGKESACNAGDPGSLPGLGRTPGEGIGYPFPYSWVPLVAQTVKNLPAIWETWVRSLGWEDPLEEGMKTHSSILAWNISIDREAWHSSVYGVPKSQTRLSHYVLLQILCIIELI